MNSTRLQSLINNNIVFIGALRINPQNTRDAYVTVAGRRTDVYLQGMFKRNRALEGDRVAVQLSPRVFWRRDPRAPDGETESVVGEETDSEEEEEEEEEEGNVDESESVNDAAAPDVAELVSRLCLAGDKIDYYAPIEGADASDKATPMAWDDVMNKDGEAPDPWLQPTGRVVAIVEATPRLEVVGTFQRPTQPTQARHATFVPNDRRVPKMYIHPDQVPPELFTNPQAMDGRLFTARIAGEWMHTAMCPIGVVTAQLGFADSIEAQTTAILRAADRFDETVWPDDVNKETSGLRARVSEAESRDGMLAALLGPDGRQTERRDMRDVRLFTIDPSTARDLDDAMHIRKAENGAIEVGVHIADVSYYVTPGSALDRIARQHGTTVYLVQKVAPMLPEVLSETACSLNPHEPRLAFSVVWTLAPNGDVLSEWFGRTIIQSSAKLAYSDAQAVLDDEPGAIDGLKARLDDPSLAGTIAGDIRGLWALAEQLRDRRFAHGAIRLDNVKLYFTLDDDGNPIEVHQQVRRDANSMIEEWMLLANIAVARRILRAWPRQALLRRHPPPKDRMLDALVGELAAEDIHLDTSSSGAFYSSLMALPAEKKYMMDVVTNMCTKPMNLAEYFCCNDLEPVDYRHYALSVGRRYADIVVHRMLDAALRVERGQAVLEGSLPTETETAVVAKRCNQRKLAAKRAQEASQMLFLTHHLDGRIARCVAVVQVIRKSNVVLYVPRFGLEERVDLQRVKWVGKYQRRTGESGGNEMLIYTREDTDATAPTILRFLDTVVVDVTTRKKGVSWSLDVSLCPPGTTEETELISV